MLAEMEISPLSAGGTSRADAWLAAHPRAALWQSAEWRVFQEAAGRKTRTYEATEGGRIRGAALVVIDRTHLGLSVWEVPRGPLAEGDDASVCRALLERIADDARSAGALRVLASPPAETGALPGWRPSGRHVHPDATHILDLTLAPDELLAQMKPKGRYNIRLAERHGVRVRESLDASSFARLAAETGARDGFTPHSAHYYETFLTRLPGAFLLLAYPPAKTPQEPSRAAEDGPAPVEGLDPETAVSGLMGVTWNGMGVYYYGASSHAARALMAPSLLQWAAMGRCRQEGCIHYDLFGVAPDGQPTHPWSGVTDFKTKLGGTYVAYPPEQELLLRPLTLKALHLKRKYLG